MASPRDEADAEKIIAFHVRDRLKCPFCGRVWGDSDYVGVDDLAVEVRCRDCDATAHGSALPTPREIQETKDDERYHGRAKAPAKGGL